jgi:hypothetical protein
LRRAKTIAGGRSVRMIAGGRRFGAGAARRTTGAGGHGAGTDGRGGGTSVGAGNLTGTRRGGASARVWRITATDCETKGKSPLPITSGRRRPAERSARVTLPRATTASTPALPSQTSR